MATSFNGINSSGQIVGTHDYNISTDGTIYYYSYTFLYNDGTFEPIVDLDRYGDSANGINDNGQIVGTLFDGQAAHGFIDTNGSFAIIDAPDADGLSTGTSTTEVYGVNDAGQMVGWYIAGGDLLSFLDTDGSFTTITDPLGFFAGISTTVVYDINNQGQIVGFYRDSTGVGYGFVETNGTFAAITDPLASNKPQLGTVARGINDAGVVVGSYYDDSGNSHGYVDDSGVFATVDIVGAVQTFVTGINNSGTIIGTWSDTNYVSHAFEGIPVTPGAVYDLTTIDGPDTGGFQLDPSPPPCFLPGTRIATPDGETPVEDLIAGDLVLTQCGRTEQVVWIGTGRALATRGRRTAATPVIVRRGALDHNVPSRDLHVTKGHALYIDDALIPVEFLVNHRSIIWDDGAQEVTVYHIELSRHAVLIADGAPAESYRDDGNRWLFSNSNGGWGQLPQQPCAPILTGGPVVDAVWRRLIERAGRRPGTPLTDDPDLHLLVDGQCLEPVARHHHKYSFELSETPSAVRCVSRAAVPAELGLARDPRALGVALRRLVVRKGPRFRVIEADDRRLDQGFHCFEMTDGIRWTDGDAIVPPELFDGFTGPFELVLHLGALTRYPAEWSARHREACAAA